MKTHINRAISKIFSLLYFAKKSNVFRIVLYVLTTLSFVGLLYIVLNQFHLRKTVIVKAEEDKELFTEEQSYLHLYEDLNNKQNEKSEIKIFTNDDFVVKKLRKLVAVSYVTSLNTSPSLKLKLDFKSYNHLIKELGVIFEVQRFYQNLLGCDELHKFMLYSPVLETTNSLTYEASYKDKKYNTQSSRADLNELLNANCDVNSNEDKESYFRCYLLKNRRLLQQYLFLSELKHSNIAALNGLCFNTEEDPNEIFLGLTVITDSGNVVDIDKLRLLPWNQRLKICYDLVQLIEYLSKSPFGSIFISDLSLVNFIQVEDNEIKLLNFDQKIIIPEKVCIHDKDCFIGGISAKVKCEKARCNGYNERRNMNQIFSYFINPLLSYQPPATVKSKTISLLREIGLLQYHSISDLKVKLKTLTIDSYNSDAQFRKEKARRVNVHADGVQVDSWQQHDIAIAINEVGIDESNLNVPAEPQSVIESKKEYKEEKLIPGNYGYKKIENADYPGRFDYSCPHSKAEWGCVMSLQTLKDAALKCDVDSKCKAFITMPHLRKDGWIIAILKNDNTNPVDHAGTTVFVKDKTLKDDNVQINNVKNHELTSSIMNCWKDIVDVQAEERTRKEVDLMNACGWKNIKDSLLHEYISENTIKQATSFKPARGKLAVGGQIHIKIELGSDSIDGIFSAKSGPEEYHLAQLAAYHLDRMLGFYKTVPIILRTLTEKEMQDAGFPKDVGGAQFDTYLPLKADDKSLTGTITPGMKSKLTWEHYITVPKLDFITNAVTPFSHRQLDDMEYLILIWLMSLPMPEKGFLCVEDHLLVHIKMEEAFRLSPTEDVIGYFFNCQFPKTFIDAIQHFHSNNCNVGDQLVSNIKHYYPSIKESMFHFGEFSLSDIVTRNANRLLEIVDACVLKFGKESVFFSPSM